MIFYPLHGIQLHWFSSTRLEPAEKEGMRGRQEVASQLQI